MGNRSKSTPGAFGGKVWVKTPEGDVISVLRPHRGRDRSKRRKVNVRGRRPLSFGDILRHNVAVKKREDAKKSSGSIFKKVTSAFQRKES